MTPFNARLRLPGQSRIPLGVEVDVSDEQITLRTGERKLAQWNLAEVDIDYLSDGFHIKVDGEEVVLSVSESSQFASALGVTASRPTPKPVAAASGTRNTGRAQADDLRRRISQMAAALGSDSVAPQTAFAEWLGLLKELNSRHARGAMPTPLFHELNTQLLDLIPEPEAAVA